MLISSLRAAIFRFCLVKVSVWDPKRFELGWLFVGLDLLKLEGWAPNFRFPNLFVLKERGGSGGGGSGGSYLPLDGKESGGGGWNRLKLNEPNPKSGPGGGLKSINGGETDLTGDGSLLLPPAALLLLFLFFGNLVMPFNLSDLFLISNSLPGWLGKFLIKLLLVPFFQIYLSKQKTYSSIFSIKCWSVFKNKL